MTPVVLAAVAALCQPAELPRCGHGALLAQHSSPAEQRRPAEQTRQNNQQNLDAIARRRAENEYTIDKRAYQRDQSAGNRDRMNQSRGNLDYPRR